MAKKVMALFYFRSPSINATVESDVIQGRIDDPTQRTYAYYLEHSSVSALNELLWKQVYIAIRSKQLDALKGSDGRFTLALDGTSLTYSYKRHCDKCLTTTYDDGTVHYHHALLVASIVDKIKKVSIVVAVIPIENTQGSDKQDCELNATKKLLKHIKKLAPQMRFNISVDGLYLSAPFVTQAKQLGHEVTMPLAKENMAIFDVFEKDFKNKKIIKQEDKDTETTIQYCSDDLSPYWPALSKSDPSIRLYGLKREIIHKKTGEVRTCVIVSTLDPIDDKRAIELSEIQRERWQQENNTFNVFKNLHDIKHIYNHKASTQVFQFAAIANNMRNIFLLRHPPQKHIKKPLTIATLLKLILALCKAPIDIFLASQISASKDG
jgi:hypothetical protein